MSSTSMSTTIGPRLSLSDILRGTTNDTNPEPPPTTTDAFLSSIVVNAFLALCLVLTFSVLRRRFKFVYRPREEPSRVVETASPASGTGFCSWVWTTMTVSDEQFLKCTDVDAFMLVRFLAMCFKIFVWAALVGVLVVVPVNVTGENNTEGFESLSMSNIAQESSRMWVHTFMAYVFTFVALYFMHQTYCDFVKLRHSYLRRQMMKGRLLSVMVRNVPTNTSTDEGLADYFRRLYPQTFKCASVVKDLTKLDKLVAEREEVVAELERAYFALEKKGKRPTHKVKCTDTCCCKPPVDSIEYYSERLEQLNRAVTEEQRAEHKTLPTGFVTFTSAKSAAIASQVEHSAVATYYRTKPAPEPEDVYWPNVGFTDFVVSTRTVFVGVALGFLILFWTVPIAFVSSIASLDTLSKEISWLEPFLNYSPSVRGFLQGFLAGVGLIIFMALLPIILDLMAKSAGVEAQSWIEQWVLKKFYLFEVLIFFLAYTLAGSTFGIISKLDSISGIPDELGKALPRYATYFIAYIMLRTLTGFPLVLLRPVPLILGACYRSCSRTQRDIESAEAPPQIQYGTEYPEHLFVFILAAAYFAIAPIILPFACLYFGVAYVVYRYMLLYVYVKQSETGGMFWPIVFNRMLVGLIVGQLTLLGVFSIKKGPYQVATLFPLPIITYLVVDRIREKFARYAEHLPLEEAAQIDSAKEIPSEELQPRVVPAVSPVSSPVVSSSSSSSSGASAAASVVSSSTDLTSLSTSSTSSSAAPASAASSSSSSSASLSGYQSECAPTGTCAPPPPAPESSHTAVSPSAAEDQEGLDFKRDQDRRIIECGRVSDTYVQASLFAKPHIDVAPPPPHAATRYERERERRDSQQDLLPAASASSAAADSTPSSSSSSASINAPASTSSYGSCASSDVVDASAV